MAHVLTERRFVFEGIEVCSWQGGRGFPVLMLHGSGPGASTAGNWRLVLDALAGHFTVFAMDLIGFGRSGRKTRPPYFDFELWCRQAAHALRLLDAERIGILGHSISGAIALKLAAREPRVTKVLTTGSMGTSMPVNEHLYKVWRCPRSREDLVTAARVLVQDHSRIDDAYLDARMPIVGDPEYQRYFDAMFAGDLGQYIEASVVTEAELAAIRCDTLMMHGRADKPFPYEHTTAPLAARLSTADVLTLAQCGHSVAFEYPHKLLSAANMLFRET